MYTYMYIYICVYAYIQREREREREKKRDTERDKERDSLSLSLSRIYTPHPACASLKAKLLFHSMNVSCPQLFRMSEVPLYTPAHSCLL